MTKTLPVLSFAKLEMGMPMPHLLDIQTRAFQALLQPDGKGAERADVGLNGCSRTCSRSRTSTGTTRSNS